MFIAASALASTFRVLCANKNNNKQAQEQYKQPKKKTATTNKKINEISIYGSIFVVYFHTLPSPGRLNMMHACRQGDRESESETVGAGAAPIACDSVSWPIGQSFFDFIFGRQLLPLSSPCCPARLGFPWSSESQFSGKLPSILLPIGSLYLAQLFGVDSLSILELVMRLLCANRKHVRGRNGANQL